MLGYSDPAIWTLSEPKKWKDLAPLISYVHSLHVPLKKLEDPTLKLDNPGISGPPRWKIRDDSFDIDSTFEIIHVGRPYTRMTTVFRGIGGIPVFVKDTWAKTYRQTELSLFQTLTADGSAPGWVDVKLPDTESNPLETPGHNGAQRRKGRIVMENTGVGFDQCSTLLEAIAAVYDVLEGNI